MIRALAPIAFSASLVAVAGQSATAASFDCSQAEARDEIAVCDNAELSALDSEMGGLWYAYNLLPFLMGESGNRHDEAEAFLHQRSQCGSDVSCLTQAYQARITTLRQDLQSGVQELCHN